MENQDYYRVLGVAPTASRREIKDAYRRLAMKHHPDRNKNNPESALKMKRVNEAYAVLANAEKKREYDAMKRQFGSSAYSRFKSTYTEKDIFSGPDIHHIFEEMAKAFGVRGYKEMFKESQGRTSRRFEFKKPGFSSRGFMFSSGASGEGARGDGRPPFLDNMGKLPEWFLKNVIGFEIPEEGDD
ncbi:MAG: DnaJ domain-containing protein, partial [Desulfobacterales bacterium]|nr:DnaJ domain-containing protein [Desulfobacterales bacterium]